MDDELLNEIHRLKTMMIQQKSHIETREPLHKVFFNSAARTN